MTITVRYRIRVTDSAGTENYVETTQGHERPGFTNLERIATSFASNASALSYMGWALESGTLEIADDDTVEVYPYPA